MFIEVINSLHNINIPKHSCVVIHSLRRHTYIFTVKNAFLVNPNGLAELQLGTNFHVKY